MAVGSHGGRLSAQHSECDQAFPTPSVWATMGPSSRDGPIRHPPPGGGGKTSVPPTPTPTLGPRHGEKKHADGLKADQRGLPGKNLPPASSRGSQGPHGAPPKKEKPAQRGHVAPGQAPRPKSYASALAGSATADEQLSYKQAAEAAKTAQRILLVKGVTEQGVEEKVPGHQDWANIIFDLLAFLPEDVTGVHFRSDGPWSSEIEVTSEETADKYAGKTLVNNNVTFQVTKIQEGEDVITFRDVPLSVPDCELIHLVKAYNGKMSKEEVFYKQEKIKTDGGVEVTLAKSSTRYIYATLPPNKRIRSYYWLQGMGAGDTAKRIVVLHKNQSDGRQCGNCLRTARDPFNPCKFAAKTSACKKNAASDRMKLADYLRVLREEDGYVSLRTICRWSDEEEVSKVEEEEEVMQPGADWAAEPMSYTPEIAQEQQQAEINRLRSLWQSERGYSSKARKETNRAKKEASSLQASAANILPLVRERVSEIIRKKQPVWEAEMKFLAEMLASTVPLKDFEEHEADKGLLVPKVNKHPLKEVENLMECLNEEEKKRLAALLEEVKASVLSLLRYWQKDFLPRPRSVSRSRVDNSDDEGDNKSSKSSRQSSPTRGEGETSPSRKKSSLPLFANKFKESVREDVLDAAAQAKELAAATVGGAASLKLHPVTAKSLEGTAGT